MSAENKKLFNKIKSLLANISLKELKSKNLLLTKKYKNLKHKYFDSDNERLAYIASRMPATYAALSYVLQEINDASLGFQIKNVLDLGSGPATAAWAVFSVFENIEKMHLVEKDNIINLGKSLLQGESFFNKLSFEQNDILKIKNYDYDLVCLSYVTTELKKPYIEKIIKRWYYSNSKIIVFLEPGTMYGFNNIKHIREKLIHLGAKIAAPCPHEMKCPMAKNDWCHFYVRLPRSKQHKYLKGGTLAYEDEKFSYLIAAKIDVNKNYARILRRPKKDGDGISFITCRNGKIVNTYVFGKDRKRYKECAKNIWGGKLFFNE